LSVTVALYLLLLLEQPNFHIIFILKMFLLPLTLLRTLYQFVSLLLTITAVWTLILLVVL
jgi:hypothetical protein